MKIIQAILAFCFAFVPMGWTATTAVAVNQPGNIQILIEKNVGPVLLEVRGGYTVYDPLDGTKISSGMSGKRFQIQSSNTGIRWGEDFPGIHQICIVPKSLEIPLFVNGIQYDGAITCYKVGNKLNIVNEVDVETYVKAILSTQISYPLETEALSAVAIAARTTAYFQANLNPKSYWHVDAKEVGYQGSALIVLDSPISHAVDLSRHLILVHAKEGAQNTLFPACWTEHCAGKTVPFHVVYRKDLNAPKTGVQAPLAAQDREKTLWSFSLDKQELAKRIGVSQVQGVELFVDSSSGKVYGIRIKSDKGPQDLDFVAFQKKVGEDSLQSNDFKVSTKENKIIFSGYGKGSGVGLCLYSASKLAQKGKMAIHILSEFFPESLVVNLEGTPKKS